MDHMDKPLIAITMGDPSGIGPEIIAATLMDPAVCSCCHPVLIGDSKAFARGCAVAQAPYTLREIVTPAEVGELTAGEIGVIPVSQLMDDDMVYGAPTAAAGEAVYRSICRATDLCLAGSVAAMATAPISKASMNQAGHDYPGHTELIAERCGTDRFVMMLAGDVLRVALVTIHEALKNVPQLITYERILQTIRITAEGVVPLCTKHRPRLAVVALNPHCGEEGLFGDEERLYIQPAIAAAQALGIDVEGPFSADTFFHGAVGTSFCYDAVIAMYHDQGLIPLKMRHFDDGINITLGLPIIRTSVDHGTAYSLAGSNRASTASMRAAVLTAAQLAART